MLGRRDLFLSLVAVGNRPLHVALAGTEPDVADQNIVDGDWCLVIGGRSQLPRFGGSGQGIEVDLPLAVRAGHSRLLLPRKFYSYSFAGRTPAPDWDGPVALQNGVIRE